MATIELTVRVRLPFGTNQAAEKWLTGEETLTLKGFGPHGPPGEALLPHIGLGLFRGEVAAGDYVATVDLGTVLRPGDWTVPQWKGHVRKERQTLQLFLGYRGWPAYPLGYSLVPFPPPHSVAIAFETAPPTRNQAESLVEALMDEVGFERFSGLGADPHSPVVSARYARGSVLLLDGDLTQQDPAGIEELVLESLDRDPRHARPRVGVPVDLRPGRTKVLDRRFLLQHEAGDSAARHLVESVGGRGVRSLRTAEGTVSFELGAGDPVAHLSTAEELSLDSAVVYVEPDLVYELRNADVFTDPLYPRRIERVPPAWDQLDKMKRPSHGSDNVTIAILDNDIPYNSVLNKVAHDQAPENQVVGYVDFFGGLDPDEEPTPNHGLHVYGIIGSPVDKSGAEGVAPGTSILLAERPSLASSSYDEILLWLCGLVEDVPGFVNASTSNPHPASIVCCAHESGTVLGTDFSNAMQRIADEARVVDDKARGALVVYAAGNHGTDIETGNGFAHDLNTVAVANCVEDPYDERLIHRASSSNFGTRINLCALGARSWTLLPVGLDGRLEAGGTSAACAVVAGAIGLLLTAFPDETRQQIVARLHEGARKAGMADGIWTAGHSEYFGHGLLDVLGSMLPASRASAVYEPGTDVYTNPIDQLEPNQEEEEEPMAMDEDTKVKVAAAVYGDFMLGSEVNNGNKKRHGYKPDFTADHETWIRNLVGGNDSKRDQALDEIEVADGATGKDAVKALLPGDSADQEVVMAIYRRLKEDHDECRKRAGGSQAHPY